MPAVQGAGKDAGGPGGRQGCRRSMWPARMPAVQGAGKDAGGPTIRLSYIPRDAMTLKSGRVWHLLHEPPPSLPGSPLKTFCP